MRGNWTWNENNCIVRSNGTYSASGVWIGSDDGIIFDNNYNYQSFSLEVIFSLDCGFTGSVGVLFRGILVYNAVNFQIVQKS